jgi:hypothetical protein
MPVNNKIIVIFVSLYKNKDSKKIIEIKKGSQQGKNTNMTAFGINDKEFHGFYHLSR